LHLFNLNDFAGCMCDESSILKSFEGVRKHQITEFMRKMRFRLLLSATPAPNDYIELGTSSEALGYLGYIDMLNRYFKNDNNNTATGRAYGEVVKWRFKGHAEEPFWKYVCYWSRSARRRAPRMAARHSATMRQRPAPTPRRLAPAQPPSPPIRSRSATVRSLRLPTRSRSARPAMIGASRTLQPASRRPMR